MPKKTYPKPIHEVRGITFAEYGALLGTRAMLLHEGEKGLVHDPDNDTPDEHSHKFNMNQGCKRSVCGTVSCIGGTMALIMQHRYPNDYVVLRGQRTMADGTQLDGHSSSLHDLFYPRQLERNGNYTGWQYITPMQAVQAIDNWLETGNAMWHKVVPNDGESRDNEDEGE